MKARSVMFNNSVVHPWPQISDQPQHSTVLLSVVYCRAAAAGGGGCDVTQLFIMAVYCPAVLYNSAPLCSAVQPPSPPPHQLTSITPFCIHTILMAFDTFVFIVQLANLLTSSKKIFLSIKNIWYISPHRS